MIEFLFGYLIGVWMAQQFKLPDVQTRVIKWWRPTPEVATQPEESVPMFTGTIEPDDTA
jgi:hypothetical protein